MQDGMPLGSGLRRVSTMRVRVAGGLVIGGVLAASWWGLLFLPLGASHDGRINGRFGLHIRNFLEDGFRESNFLASMEPFSGVPYTHHPPLLNVLHAVLGTVLGQGEWQLHLVGYAAGLGTVAGLVWLARELDLGAGASVVALALVAVTPMFWIYARLGLGVSLIVAFLALRYRCRRMEGHRRVLPLAAGVVGFASWIGVLVVAMSSVQDWKDTRTRRVAVAMGIAGLSAAVLALVWAVGAGQATELVDHAGNRLQWPAWSELADNYRWFYRTLFPGWFRWMILPALVVSVADRRTRPVAATVLAALGIWTLMAPGAALIHDYWTYPLLVPVFLGLAAGLHRIRVIVGDGRIVMYVVVLALAATGLDRLPDYRDAYFREPSRAGALIRDVPPAPDQEIAWLLEGVDPLPRWVSYYWDLPTSAVTADNIDRVGATELVLIRLDRLPEWVQADLEPETRQGRYALTTGRALRSTR